MTHSVDQIADDWIAYTRYAKSDDAPDDLFDRSYALYVAAREQPEFAWEAIKQIVRRYSEDDLFVEPQTEAKRILGNLGAGPLEDLLSYNGPSLIDAIEAGAKEDRRVQWTLGCVWQNAMSDDVWDRVQRAAGYVSR